MRRDFRRAAVFLWMTPAPAALSNAAIAAARASGVLADLARVFSRDVTAWFRTCRFAAWRLCFSPDRERFATANLLV